MSKPKITQKGEFPGDLSLPKPVTIPIGEKEIPTEDQE